MTGKGPDAPGRASLVVHGARTAWFRYGLVWLAVAAMVMLGSVAAFTYFSYRDAAQELVIERDKQLAILSAARLEDELRKLAGELEALARTEDFVTGDHNRQRRALETARRRLSVFDGGVVLLDEFGRVRAAVPPRPRDNGKDWSDRPYFRQLLGSGGVVFADTKTDGVGDTPAVVVSVPILGRDGEFQGALAGLFGLGEPTVSAFYAGIVRLRLGQSGTTYLVGSDGSILFDSQVEKTGGSFAQRAVPGLALTDQGTAMRTRDAEGNDVVAAQVPVPGTPWHLVTEDDWGTLTRNTRPWVRLLFAIVAVALLLPVVGVAVVARGRPSRSGGDGRDGSRFNAGEEMQQALLPTSSPVLPGWRVVGKVAAGANGVRTLYDWRILPDGALVVALSEAGDEEGMAMAALTTVRAALRGAAGWGTPAEGLTAANELLCTEVQLWAPVRGIVARIEPDSGKILCAAAGTMGPHLLKELSLSALGEPGPPIGERPGAAYHDFTCTVEPGQIILLCSMGLLEATSVEGERFGDRCLSETACAHPMQAHEMARAIMTSWTAFSVGAGGPRSEGAIVLVERLAGIRTEPPEVETDDDES